MTAAKAAVTSFVYLLLNPSSSLASLPMTRSSAKFVAPISRVTSSIRHGRFLLCVLALALPAWSSAQVQLISGYNFGQFLGAGYPSLNGATGDPVTSVGSNFRLTTQAPNSSSGDFVGLNATVGNYSNGFGRIYWDGTNGSSAFNLWHRLSNVLRFTTAQSRLLEHSNI